MKAAATTSYDTLRRLLTYPGAGYVELVQCAPETLSQLEPFAAGVKGLSLIDLQELFTRTFDLSPTCSLEVGWHLFGEEYARGAFMVSMREELRNQGLTENGELPDHLTHVLLLIDSLGADDRAKLISSYVLPAVRKMVEALEGKDNPYGVVVKTVARVLEQTPGVEAALAEHSYQFRILGNHAGSQTLEEEAPHG